MDCGTSAPNLCDPDAAGTYLVASETRMASMQWSFHGWVGDQVQALGYDPSQHPIAEFVIAELKGRALARIVGGILTNLFSPSETSTCQTRTCASASAAGPPPPPSPPGRGPVGGRPPTVAAGGVRPAPSFRNSQFRSQAHLDDHFARHGAEWGVGNITKDGYVRRAQTLLSSTPGGNILGRTRTNGDIVRYNRRTNEFAVGASDGTIRTLFRPQDGIDYFNRTP